MTRRNLIILILAVAILLALAMLLSRQNQQQIQDSYAGKIYLQDLSVQLNTISDIFIQRGTDKVHLRLDNGLWVVSDKDSYAADVAKIRKLLLALGELKTYEPKTSKPENYARLGVVDPTDSNSSQWIRLKDNQGNELLSLIVGEARGNTTYMRKMSEKQSWLIKGELSINTAAEDWLDKDIINIPGKEIKQIQVTAAGQNTFTVAKQKQEDANFTIVDLPAGKHMKNESAADGLALQLSPLSYEKVKVQPDFKFNDKKSSRLIYETYAGLRVIIDLQPHEKNYYLKLNADLTAQAAADTALQRQVALIKRRGESWLYTISSQRGKQLDKKLADYIK